MSTQQRSRVGSSTNIFKTTGLGDTTMAETMMRSDRLVLPHQFNETQPHAGMRNDFRIKLNNSEMISDTHSRPAGDANSVDLRASQQNMKQQLRKSMQFKSSVLKKSNTRDDYQRLNGLFSPSSTFKEDIELDVNKLCDYN